VDKIFKTDFGQDFNREKSKLKISRKSEGK